MKTYEQRTQSIQAKIKKKKTQRKIIGAAASGLCCFAIGLLLFRPDNTPAPSVSKHQEDSYSPLIQVLKELRVNKYNGINIDYDTTLDDVVVDAPTNAPTSEAIPNAGNDNSSSTSDTGSYKETTDLQVQGVGEADLIKRSDRYIYYLHDTTLKVYSIQGEDSQEVGSYTDPLPDGTFQYRYNYEMYLSQDCTTITLLTEGYQESKYVRIVSLDVTEPENIRQISELTLSGSYDSSRMIDGKLYVISRYYVSSTEDFDDKSTYLPSYQVGDETTYLPMNCIVLPEDPKSAMYTVVTKVSEKSLEVEDSVALLSYTGVEYVSENNIFLTHQSYKSISIESETFEKDVTEISQIRYTGEGLEYIASFTVEGQIKNQYSMDEKDGILRVVATIQRSTVRKVIDGEYAYYDISSTTNASLYCIDLSDHSIRASVEQFAPEGESVRSVRFDGDNAYVCTSIVLSDPVFFFDLSDLDNITCKDTGTITGYSISLVNYQDGFLMGIGYGSSLSRLKIEMYREDASTVEPYCSYEIPNCYFSTDYKAYYIDRENNLIGLGVREYSHSQAEYVLLHFDGYELVELRRFFISGEPADMRAVYVDGYLYVLADEFHVEKIA